MSVCVCDMHSPHGEETPFHCAMDQSVNRSTNALVNGGVSVSPNGALVVCSQAGPISLKQGSPHYRDNNNHQGHIDANMPHASAFGMIDTAASEVPLIL